MSNESNETVWLFQYAACTKPENALKNNTPSARKMIEYAYQCAHNTMVLNAFQKDYLQNWMMKFRTANDTSQQSQSSPK